MPDQRSAAQATEDEARGGAAVVAGAEVATSPGDNGEILLDDSNEGSVNEAPIGRGNSRGGSGGGPSGETGVARPSEHSGIVTSDADIFDSNVMRHYSGVAVRE